MVSNSGVPWAGIYVAAHRPPQRMPTVPPARRCLPVDCPAAPEEAHALVAEGHLVYLSLAVPAGQPGFEECSPSGRS